MAIRSGFFNSINGDRKYDASRFAEYFASFIGNGVFPNPSDNLQVIANNNMTITVKPGKAWINGYILINDDDYILEIEPADGVLNRIDRVVARYDTADREIRLEVKKGSFASSPVAPTLQRDADAYELALADIYIAKGAVSITQANITDLRLNTELCGIVHGVVDQVDTTTLFNQYLSWYQQTTEQADADLETMKQQFQAEFDAWFAGLKDILDENTAANLFNLINQVESDLASHKNENATNAHKINNIEGLQDALNNAGKVKSVNGKIGEVVLDVGDIAGLNAQELILGQNASAANVYAVALGNEARAGLRGVAIGYRSDSTPSAGGIAIGQDAKITGQFKNYSIALGPASTVSASYACAIGYQAVSENTSEIVIGISNCHVKIPGNFTVSGTKNFEIPHPKPEKRYTHVIRHGAVESPTPGDTLYRWRVQATKDNDIVTIDLPDYFVWLNKDIQIFVTPQGHFGNGYGILNEETEQLEIYCQYAGEYNILAIGTRNDDHPSVQEWYIKGVEREIGESWTGETYAFSIDEIIEIEEIKEVSV